MGRGVEATSTMAQMRSAIRTLIAIDPDPEAVMRGLDRVFESWHLEQLVTVVYGIVDSDRGEVSIINAGHPYPLLVHAGGEVEAITTSQTLILGAGGGKRTVATHPIAPDETIFVYSDGLIERRGENLDHSVERLALVTGRLRHAADLAPSLAELVDDVRDPTRDDDVVAMALRRS